VADANGKPMHSWRVLILPYIEEQGLYDAYDFSQPWNSPANRQLAARMPRTYCCPSRELERATGVTHYAAVVGSGTAWPGATATRFSQFTDGTDETLLLVETHDGNICWLEPRDLPLATLPLEVNPPGQPGISSRHLQGANAAFADGSVPTLSAEEITPAKLKALLTIAGGD
jgi:prepilin-type processing-associated H-X9-DG protein